MTQTRKRTKLNPAGKLLLIHSCFLLMLFVLVFVFRESYYQIIAMIAGALALMTAFCALAHTDYFEDEIYESDDNGDIDYDLIIEKQYKQKEREDAERS